MTRDTLATLATHAVRDLSRAECKQVFTAVKDRLTTLKSVLKKAREAAGLDADDYANDTTPLGNIIRLYEGSNGLLAIFTVDEEDEHDATRSTGSNPNQLEIEDEARASSAETGGLLKRHIEHSDGPPRDLAAEADTISILSEPPTVEEIENAQSITEQSYRDPAVTLEVILGGCKEYDDIDRDSLLKSIETWSPEMRRRAEHYIMMTESFAHDVPDHQLPMIPRLMYESLCRASTRYREQNASLSSELIDDSPVVDETQSNDDATALAPESAIANEASQLKLTPAQIGALQIIHETKDDGGISESTLKKMRGAKVVTRAKGDRVHTITPLGVAFIEHYNKQREQNVAAESGASDDAVRFGGARDADGDLEAIDDESGVANDPGYGSAREEDEATGDGTKD